MKYRIEKSNLVTRVVDSNGTVIDLTTIRNYKLLGVLLKAVALTKKESIVDTTGGATGFFKEGLTQYELSGAKLYADFNHDNVKVSLPYFKGKFHSKVNTTQSYSEAVKNGATFRAVI